MTDDFANNPFKALRGAGLKLKDADAKGKDAPGAKARPAKAAPAPKASGAPAAPGPADALQAEDDIFLRAMGAMGRKARAPQPQPHQRDLDERPFGDLLKEHERHKAARDARDAAPADPGPATQPLRRRETQPPAAPAALPEPPDPEDAALFLGAMGDVARLDGTGGRDVPKAVEPPAPPAPAHPEALAREQLRRLVRGEIDFQLEFTEEYQHGHVTGLDPKIFNKLRAGAFSVEAHHDLHGLNTEQALYSTVDFIRRSYLLGRRTLVLVTGRGRNSPDGRGILRDEVQLWLTREPLRRVVLAFVTAQPRDGGPGALYVLLRKHKKSLGKVQWDRLPADWDA
ncbi:Smr/MutS family protein [Desulfocurvus vexinensis]|uniref:Smr/MutS family protein n=1 Tax=Desulfocurvus vexinensis TaxID=399548 RepID=UPI0004B2330F|nr:Smr/MutS family protein [Desulfocurvus vexinensis]